MDSRNHQEIAIEPAYRPRYSRDLQVYSQPSYMDPPPEDFSSEETLGLLDYWRLLKRRRGTLVLFAFLGMLLGVLFTLPQASVYKARTALEIENMNSEFLNTKQVNPLAEDNGAQNVLTDVQTQMKILQSEQLVARVLDKLREQGKLAPLLQGGGRFAPLRRLLNIPPKKLDADYKLRKVAMDHLTVREIGQTRVVEALYKSNDPQFAADFCNTLATEYIQSNMEARWRMSERTGEWLTAQLEEMRVKLEKSEAALQDYAVKSGLLFTGTPNNPNNDKTNVSEERLREVQEELSKAQADRATAQSRYEMASNASPETVGEVLNDQELRDLLTKLTDLRRQRADLIAIYTPKHEKVKRIEAQIQPLEAEFNRERADIITRIKNDYDAAVRREKLLEADYKQQSGVVTDQAGKAIQYNILKREVDSNRTIYESIMQQVRETSVASAIRASNIRVVDTAFLPHDPDSPNLLLNMLVGFAAGLVLGIMTVIVRERADRTLQEPGDAQFWTNLPELGVIPSAKLDHGKFAYGVHTAGELGESRNGSPGLLSKRDDLPLELVTWNRKPSVVAEAFRTVLTSILFLGENGTRPKVLVLTSGNPGDGKTTAVSNLAIAAAEIRRKVLIIDADLRRPRLHELFGIPNERGLSSLLRSDALELDDLDEIVQPTSIPNVYVLTGGPPTPAAAHLLYSPGLPELLAKIRREYDMVFIDTPPSLHLTDARVLGRLADGVVFVARIGQTTKDVAIALSQRFGEDRTRVLGTILNDWDPNHSPKGYYGYQSGSARYAQYYAKYHAATDGGPR